MSSTTKIKRVGVLTGGGDCPGLNAVIRAVVKTGVFDYDLEAVGFLDGFDGLVRNRAVDLSESAVSGILTAGGTMLGTSNTAHPFEYVEPGSEGQEPQDVSDRCIDTFQIHGLDVLICIGGDGTLSIAHQLAQKGLPVVGVPKTIDNDLYGTDVTTRRPCHIIAPWSSRRWGATPAGSRWWAASPVGET